jgi:GntR family transcriptional regulator
MNATLFRPVPAPLYRQIEEHLARQIYDGTLPVESLLPSDAQLCTQFGVSRITVRTAIDRLVAANLVKRRAGVGTYVLGPDHGVQTARLVGHVDDIHPRMNFKILHSSNERLPEWVDLGGDVDMAASYRCFVGVNHIGSKPFSFLQDYYPQDLARFISEEDYLGAMPPVRLLEMRSGLRFSHAVQRLDAVAAPPHVASAIEVTEGSPVIRMVRTYFETAGRPLDIAVAHYHPDRYRFEIKLISQHVRGSAGNKADAEL